MYFHNSNKSNIPEVEEVNEEESRRGRVCKDTRGLDQM